MTTTPTILALHGMACTGRVWDPLAAAWDGPFLAPDLGGHGEAPRLEEYRVASYAADLRQRLAAELEAADRLIVVGHSLGGAVGAELLPQLDDLFRADDLALLAIGIKTVWTDDDIAGSKRVADKGVRWFEGEDEARGWFLKVSGLWGIVDPGSEIAGSGVEEVDGRFRLKADPETFRTSAPPPPLAGQLAATSRPVRLSRGGDDEMVTVDQVEPFDADFLTFDQAGHSAHVEQPEQVAKAARALLSPR